MIADTLENLHKYKSNIPYAEEILAYLDANDISSLKAGKHQISGESAYILIQEYATKPESEKKWESHRKYIDIQIVLNGEEFMGYAPVRSLEIQDNYNEKNDVIIYHNDTREHGMLLISKNCFSIFFPEDAHKPGFHIKKETAVKKAVIKAALT